MLWGCEGFPFVLEFLREKQVVLHALTHPETFAFNVEDEYLMISYTDVLKLFGAIPVSARNLFKLLSRNSYSLLYPGGAREAFHRKLMIDYDEMKKNPLLNQMVDKLNQGRTNVR
ncbi:hypothetical protein R6Q57_025347 [Mikania cordata]